MGYNNKLLGKILLIKYKENKKMEDLFKIIGLLLISIGMSIGAGLLAYVIIHNFPDATVGISMLAGFITPISFYIRKAIKEKQ